MSAMVRLQPWLMAGIGCFALSVGLIGLSVNPAMPLSTHPTLAFFGYAAMTVGSFFILMGMFGIVAIPEIIWHLGRFGRFDRAIKRRIRAGRKALEGALTHEQDLEWTRTTEAVLSAYLGIWHPQFAKFNSAGIVEGTEGFGHERKLLLAKRMNVLSELRKTIRDNRNTFVIFRTSLKV